MPPQEAPQFASAPSAVSAPPIPSPLFPIPPYRMRQFAKGVGERLRNGAQAGESEQVILDAIVAERTALADALNDQAVRETFAQSYRQAHDKLAPNAPLSMEASRTATDEILTNRINDARQLALLVTQPDFINAARAQAALPAAANDNYQLPPEKIAEMIAQFSSGADALIHAQQAMEGQRTGHLALAETFTPDGPLVDVLQQALAKHLDAATAQRLAVDWLVARRNPALATAQTLGEQGEVYSKVIQQVSTAHHNAQIERKPLADAAHALLPATAVGVSAPMLLRSTSLSPVEREERKTSQQKAEDVMYTLNHAITCLSITDTLIAPGVAAMSEKWFGKRINICGHDHDHDDHHHDDHHHDDHGPDHHDHKKPFFKRLGNWMIGEVAGDVGAVVPTVLMQRFTPGIMNGIRSTLEPVVGGFFRRGTQRAAQSWAVKNNLAPDDQAVVNRAQELYEYEVSHLPQMAVWTISSVLINFGVMKYRDKHLEFRDFIGPKAAGAAVTAGLVVSARAISPNAAHSWDQTMGGSVVAPLTKLLGKPFGIKDEDVDRFTKKRVGDDTPQWQGRLQEKAPELAPSA